MGNGRVKIGEEELERFKVTDKRTWEMINELREKRRREPAPAPPKGGISLRAASRKYRVPQTTISSWIKSAFLPVLLRTNVRVYVDENQLLELVRVRANNTGRGNRSVSKAVRNNGEE